MYKKTAIRELFRRDSRYTQIIWYFPFFQSFFTFGHLLWNWTNQNVLKVFRHLNVPYEKLIYFYVSQILLRHITVIKDRCAVANSTDPDQSVPAMFASSANSGCSLQGLLNNLTYIIQGSHRPMLCRGWEILYTGDSKSICQQLSNEDYLWRVVITQTIFSLISSEKDNIVD